MTNGTKCAVPKCPSRKTPSKVQTFTVPKHPQSLHDEWLKQIKRQDSENLRVCEIHFAGDDFLPEELNIGKRKKPLLKKKLRTFAVPTLNLQCDDSSQPIQTALTSSSRFGAKIVKHDHHYCSELECDIPAKRPRLCEDFDEPCDLKDCKESRDKVKSLQDQVQDLQNELKELKASLAKIFYPDQLKKLQNPQSLARWSDKTLEDSIGLLYSMKGHAYEVMRKKGFPIPSKRTLQSHLQKIDCPPGGTVKGYLKSLEVKTRYLDRKDKCCGIVGDEMHIDAKLEFDAVKQEFVGKPTLPTSENLIKKRLKKGITPDQALAHKAFELLCVGCRLNFKQLMAYHLTDAAFDCEAAAKWMLEVFGDIQSIGLEITFFTSDMGTQMVKI